MPEKSLWVPLLFRNIHGTHRELFSRGPFLWEKVASTLSYRWTAKVALDCVRFMVHYSWLTSHRFWRRRLPIFFFFLENVSTHTYAHTVTVFYSFFFFFCKAVWRVLVLTPKSDNKHCSAEWGITETLSAQYTVHLPGRTVQNCSVWQCYVFLIGPERKPMKHPPLPDNKTVHYILYQCC